MTRFDLGPGAPVDLDRLVDTRLLVQANSGGGKSWCLRRILEQTHGRVQHLVIDPEGEFASLREKFDYVLAARQGGDTAADPRSAKLLAEKLLELKVSTILDIYELKAHERVRFVRAFLEALVDAPKSLWHPALVVVDESHVYCPQVGDAESSGAVIDLATRGRKRGFSAILATQRLSKLHKDAAAECNNVLIGRTGLDVDMKRAADTLGLVGREEMHALRELRPGEFHAFGPAFDPLVRHVVVGPVATSHPKAGSRIAFTAPPPTDKVRALLPQLADLPAEAEARTNSLEDLKRDVAELRRKLTIAEKAAPAPERVEVPVVTGRDVGELQRLLGDLQNKGDELTVFGGRLLQSIAAAQRSAPARPVAVPNARAAPRQDHAPANRSAARVERSEPNGIPPARQRVLDALAFMESVGLGAADRTQLALLADTTATSSGYANNLGALRTAGLIEYPGNSSVALTEAGRGHANAPESPPTTAELHEMLKRKLAPPRWSIIEELVAAYPDSVDRDELAARCGTSPTSSGYANNLGALRSLGLIEYPSRGAVVAQSVLFLDRA